MNVTNVKISSNTHLKRITSKTNPAAAASAVVQWIPSAYGVILDRESHSVFFRFQQLSSSSPFQLRLFCCFWGRLKTLKIINTQNNPPVTPMAYRRLHSKPCFLSSALLALLEAEWSGGSWTRLHLNFSASLGFTEWTHDEHDSALWEFLGILFNNSVDFKILKKNFATFKSTSTRFLSQSFTNINVCALLSSGAGCQLSLPPSSASYCICTHVRTQTFTIKTNHKPTNKQGSFHVHSFVCSCVLVYKCFL